MNNLVSKEDTERKRYLCKDKTNIFIVGHNSGVVSFYSQQCRAFHLATLLGEMVDNTEKSTKRVAILGGGVAGVTVWTALRELGFENATIFEATDMLLSRQQESEHRHAHPCINEWPHLDGKRLFSSSTKWPFLNWYGASASSVLRQLRADPTFTHHAKNAENEIRPNHTITSVSEVNNPISGSTTVQVAYKSPDGNEVDTFDFVVCALGYGYEDDLQHSASKSYWWSDHIINYIRDNHEFSNSKRFVSGIGDGGLIDVIRLASASGADHSINTALEVVGSVRRAEFTVLDNHWPQPKDTQISEIEQGLKTYLGSHVIDETIIRDTFDPLFKRPNFREKFARDEDLRRLFLISRDGSYLRKKASFVNQVLVTYLRTIHPDLVLKAKLVNGKVMKTGPSKRLCDQPDENGRPTESIKVIRHGAVPKVNDLIGEDVEVADDRNTDSVLHDYSVELDQLRKNKRPSENDFVAESILLLARGYCNTYFDGIDCDWSRDDENDEPILAIRYEPSKENREAYRKLGGFDRELFNVPVRYEPLHSEKFTDESIYSD